MKPDRNENQIQQIIHIIDERVALLNLTGRARLKFEERLMLLIAERVGSLRTKVQPDLTLS
jgi:hypothetical protein